MVKETKRKGFNFYRSYYDVFNELSDKDKLIFIKALLDKQFLNIEPSNLTGMVKFAWISQYNSIDQQVKGYKSKTKDPMQGGCQGGGARGGITPTLQEEEKGQGKEEEKEEYTKSEFDTKKEKFILWFNQQKEIKTGKKGMVRVLSKTDDNNLKKLFKDYKLSDFQIALDNMFKNTWVQENKMYTIAHLLAINNFNRYLGEGEKEPKKVIKNLYD